MTAKKRNTITLISLLTLMVIITTVFVLAFTFAGSPEAPDSIATYSRGKLTWSGVSVDGAGVADLGIFGDHAPGELPLIHPYSKGTYYLRLKNDVVGTVGYSLYFYTDNPTEIPLEFNVTRTNEMSDVLAIPVELMGKQIVTSVSGIVDGRNMRNLEVKWNWKTESDLKDTQLGDKAVSEDLIYTIKLLVVIEDNNSYSEGFGGGGAAVGGASGARILHRNYILGYPEGDFRPENNIARSEVSAIFARILANYDEDSLKDTNADFLDVKSEDWHAKYITRLEDSNIVSGYPDDTFRPDDFITRAEFAAVCVRFFESRAGTIKNASSDFNDIDDSHWAKEYIDKSQKQGFVTGYPDGSVRPDAFITRAEVVAGVNRMLSRYPDKTYIDNNLDNLIEFTDIQDNTYWAYYEIYEAANIHHTIVSYKAETWHGVIKNK